MFTESARIAAEASPAVSVVIPCLDEADTLAPCIAMAREHPRVAAAVRAGQRPPARTPVR